MTRRWLASCVITAAMAAACEREARPFGGLPPAPHVDVDVQSPLQAGPPIAPRGTTSPYQENAWGIGEGKRLFTAYNCAGCHANGGGGIGPALMDDEWRYGYTAANLYAAIAEGRPNGMPAWQQKLTPDQIWQLVAYVQSMSGQTPIDASPGRSDHMHPQPPELVRPYQGRTQTGHK